jgi:hypothetical protein
MRMKLLKKVDFVAENGGLAPAPNLLLLAHSSMGHENAMAIDCFGLAFKL